MGVSGCGKSTIAGKISTLKNIPYFDADDFHSTPNKDKMRQGIPLTDEDRQDWLASMNEMLKVESNKKGCTLACSALKERYRQKMIEGVNAEIHWIVLHGDFDLIYDRMKKRKDHYMPASLLQSQFDAIEYPEYGMHIRIEENPDQIVNEILKL